MQWRQQLLERAKRKIEEHWPEVQQLFHEKVGPVALEMAADDVMMKRASKLVYDGLPLPVRLAVKEDVFIEFCLDNRDLLLASMPKEESTT